MSLYLYFMYKSQLFTHLNCVCTIHLAEEKHVYNGIDIPTELYFSSRCETFHLIDYNFSIK